MSDDLISRKALLDRFRYEDKESESDKAWICAVRRMIKEQPTAFDKENVIEELRQEAMYELGIPEKKFNSDKGEYSCYCAISFSQAKRIVEKGGIK